MQVEVFKALTDESRLRILNLLMQRETCVCDIETILNLSQSNVSRHLNKLKFSGLVDSRKQAQWIYYSLNETFVKDHPYLISHLKSVFASEPVYTSDLDILANQKNLNRCVSC